MRGKILISLLALGAASAALANGNAFAPASVAAAPEVNYFDGLYLGVGAGVQHQTGDVQNGTENTIKYDNSSSSSFYKTSIDSDFGKTSFNGDIFAGYGKTFNSLYYAGVELYARYANTKPSVSSSVVGGDEITKNWTDIRVNSDFSFGSTLKFGYLITPKTMIYLLAGIERTKFDVDVDRGAKDNDPSFNFDLSHKYGFSENKWAFVPGIGIETMLTDNLSLSAQYTYADYGKISHNDNYKGQIYTNDVRPVRLDVSSDSSNKVSLERGLFSLRLAYHFNGI